MEESFCRRGVETEIEDENNNNNNNMNLNEMGKVSYADADYYYGDEMRMVTAIITNIIRPPEKSKFVKCEEK